MDLTHLDDNDRPKMVDVSNKTETTRIASNPNQVTKQTSGKSPTASKMAVKIERRHRNNCKNPGIVAITKQTPKGNVPRK